MLSRRTLRLELTASMPYRLRTVRWTSRNMRDWHLSHISTHVTGDCPLSHHPTPSDELKNDEFRHEYLGQLNAYVSYYKETEMHEGDNPPVGILLCTRKGKKMVEYAIAGMDNNLFVSTYMLQLPDRATLERFLSDELQDMHEMDM